MNAPQCRSVGLLILLMLAAGPRRADACMCINSTSPCQAFASSPSVFVGEMLSTLDAGNQRRMRLRVIRALKGIATPTAELWSDRSSCGVTLDEGTRYVIYTSLEHGRMWIGACSVWRALEPGEPEPELPPVPGRVYGQVTRVVSDSEWEYRREPIPSVRLSVDLPAGRVSETSDQWGRFRFADVPPGDHAMTVDAGPSLTSGAQSLRLSAEEGCADLHLVLKPAGTVSGLVTFADGRPAPGIYVRLLRDEAEEDETASDEIGGETDADGRFSIDGLTPASYLVAINPNRGDPSGHAPYAATWFGGVDRATATRLALADGAHVEVDGAFVLPPPLPTRTFTIAATCRDGSVPPDVLAFASADGASYAENASRTDGPIRQLTLMRDRRYAVSVSILTPARPERPWRDEQALPQIEIPAGAPGRHIALVAPFTNCGEDPP